MIIPARLMTAIALTAALTTTGCGPDIEPAPPAPSPGRGSVEFDIEAPRILAGTVASQCIVLGNRPALVRGYGLVIGLDDTGSRDLPPDLRAYMLGELGKRYSGREGLIDAGFPSVNALIDSEDTAVVIVEAVIPPGAVRGTNFDVRVVADPRSGTSSLEGGYLLPTELRPPDEGELLPATDGRGGFSLAGALGPVFVNPFAEPGSTTINTTTARIMNGGQVFRDLPLKLRLGRPSFALASAVTRAINTRFPEEFYSDRQQWLPTAHGRTDEVIDLRVPPTYAGRTNAFLQLVQHTTVRLVGAESVAMSVRRLVEEDPTVANDASWRWQALGPKTLGIFRDLYEHDDERLRFAALRAGAGLDDALVIPPLIETAKSSRNDLRREAIRLLGAMRSNLTIDHGLREILDDPDVDVRLTAYDALAKRGDPWMDRYGVGEKFALHVVESDAHMIYITQVREPRVVVFGRGIEIQRPLTAQAWGNRLLVRETPELDELEIYYRKPGRSAAVVESVSPDLIEFVQYLGRTPRPESPEPGLDLSYGDTVGAIYQIWRQGYIPADFKSEQDRVLAAIREFQQDTRGTPRPEFGDPDFDDVYPETRSDAPAVEPDFDWVPSTPEALDGYYPDR